MNLDVNRDKAVEAGGVVVAAAGLVVSAIFVDGVTMEMVIPAVVAIVGGYESGRRRGKRKSNPTDTSPFGGMAEDLMDRITNEAGVSVSDVSDEIIDDVVTVVMAELRANYAVDTPNVTETPGSPEAATGGAAGTDRDEGEIGFEEAAQEVSRRVDAADRKTLRSIGALLDEVNGNASNDVIGDSLKNSDAKTVLRLFDEIEASARNRR